jgi:hypothetical protein
VINTPEELRIRRRRLQEIRERANRSPRRPLPACRPAAWTKSLRRVRVAVGRAGDAVPQLLETMEHGTADAAWHVQRGGRASVRSLNRRRFAMRRPGSSSIKEHARRPPAPGAATTASTWFWPVPVIAPLPIVAWAFRNCPDHAPVEDGRLVGRIRLSSSRARGRLRPNRVDVEQLRVTVPGRRWGRAVVV